MGQVYLNTSLFSKCFRGIIRWPRLYLTRVSPYITLAKVSDFGGYGFIPDHALPVARSSSFSFSDVILRFSIVGAVNGGTGGGGTWEARLDSLVVRLTLKT